MESLVLAGQVDTTSRELPFPVTGQHHAQKRSSQRTPVIIEMSAKVCALCVAAWTAGRGGRSQMDCLIPCIMSRIHKCFITIIIISVIIKPSPAPPRPAPPACL